MQITQTDVFGFFNSKLQSAFNVFQTFLHKLKFVLHTDKQEKMYFILKNL